ncbi:unnamed protein product, partial [Discosporangium mesarthrocarpum]
MAELYQRQVAWKQHLAQKNCERARQIREDRGEYARSCKPHRCKKSTIKVGRGAAVGRLFTKHQRGWEAGKHPREAHDSINARGEVRKSGHVASVHELGPSSLQNTQRCSPLPRQGCDLKSQRSHSRSRSSLVVSRGASDEAQHRRGSLPRSLRRVSSSTPPALSRRASLPNLSQPTDRREREARRRETKAYNPSTGTSPPAPPFTTTIAAAAATLSTSGAPADTTAAADATASVPCMDARGNKSCESNSQGCRGKSPVGRIDR